MKSIPASSQIVFINEIILKSTRFDDLLENLSNLKKRYNLASNVLLNLVNKINFIPFFLNSSIIQNEKIKLAKYLCRDDFFASQKIIFNSSAILAQYLVENWLSKNETIENIFNKKHIENKLQISKVANAKKMLSEYSKAFDLLIKIQNEENLNKVFVENGFYLNGKIDFEENLDNSFNQSNVSIGNILKILKITDYLKKSRYELEYFIELFNLQPFNFKIFLNSDKYFLEKNQIKEWANLVEKQFKKDDRKFKSWKSDILKTKEILEIPFEIYKAISIHLSSRQILKRNLNSQRKIPIFLMGDHNAAYLAWKISIWQKRIPQQKYILIHVDTHCDLNQSYYPDFEYQMKMLERNWREYNFVNKILNENILISGFISPAIADDIVGEMWWLIPQWAKPGDIYFSAFFNSNDLDGWFSQKKIININVFFENNDLFSKTTINKLDKKKVKKAELIKVYTEELPIFNGDEAILLDIDLDFFNNTGWDTNQLAKDELSLKDVFSNIDKFFFILRNKNVFPAVITIADSPEYTEKNKIAEIRNQVLHVIKKYYDNPFEILQLKPSYSKETIENLNSLNQHMITILNGNFSREHLLQVITFEYPNNKSMEHNPITSPFSLQKPLPSVVPQYYAEMKTRIVEAFDFDYFIEYAKRLQLQFFLKANRFDLLDTLFTISVKLKKSGLNEDNFTKLKELQSNISTILTENSYINSP